MAKEIELSTLRHSTAHVMAEAVLELFPDAQIAIGPAIENGFYYDFDLPRPLTDADLETITKNMRKIINSGREFVRKEVTREEAKEIFKNQKYKLELLEAIPEGETVTTYTQGSFTDLCRGPHVESTKELCADGFKLLSIAGAYWRGNEKNKMLTRIYATAWGSKEDLRAYMDHLADIEKRDHRKLGKELDLFSLHEEAGPGLVYWHPRGARIRQTIEQFWREEHYKNGYEMVYTPHVGKSWLWETSGHLGFYKDSMYPPMEMDNTDYYVKPMNCPFHIMIYKNSLKSYRDLPCRWAELGTVYRYEKAGALHGLMRVRGFTQDDAHIFMREDQIESEIIKLINFIDRMYKVFGLTYDIELSTRPEEKYIGSIEIWDKSEAILEKACHEAGHDCKINPGDGAFYGPKLDFHIKDSLGRVWQCGTIQLDMNLPERFDLTYVDADGSKKRPIMLHRVIYGSIERFIGILIEHYAGAFPTWLSPVQVNIIPVNNEYHLEYANNLKKKFEELDIRCELDSREEKLGYKTYKPRIGNVGRALIKLSKKYPILSAILEHRKNTKFYDTYIKDMPSYMDKDDSMISVYEKEYNPKEGLEGFKTPEVKPEDLFPVGLIPSIV